MKYLFSILCLVLVLTSCNSPSNNEMLVTGEVKGLKKGILKLQKIEDTVYISVDSIEVNGTPVFNFSEEVSDPEVYYLTMSFQDSSNIIKRLPFFAEAGEIHITTSLENYYRDAVIKGSVNQTKLDEYAVLMKRFNEQKLELIEDELNALKDGNDSLAKTIQSKQDRLLKYTYLASVNFAANNIDLEVAPYIMLTEVYDVNVKYLDTIYTSLTPKIKDSKYGKALESFIIERKK